MTIIGKRYIILKKVGKGAFGSVYKARDKLTNKIVAIKLENIQTVQKPQLEYEWRVYTALRKLPHNENVNMLFPLDFGYHHSKYRFMVLPYIPTTLASFIQKKESIAFENGC